jgi:hypothetical protein
MASNGIVIQEIHAKYRIHSPSAKINPAKYSPICDDYLSHQKRQVLVILQVFTGYVIEHTSERALGNN